MGNIKKFRDRYKCYVPLGRDEKGKMRYKVIYGKTKKECEMSVKEFENAQYNGFDPMKKYSFQEISSRWADTLTDISPNTRTQYLTMLKEINAYMGKIQINKLKVGDFKSLIAEEWEKGKTNESYLKKVKVICNGVMNYAVENNLIGYNPFLSAKLPNNMEKGTREALTEDQQKALLDHWRVHRIGIGALIMFYCGLRRGELLALRWSDIDLEKGILRVNKSVRFDSNRPVEKEGGKTKNASRELLMHSALIEALKEWRKNPESLLSQYICFTSSGDHKGEVMTQSAFDRAWERLMIRLNIACGGCQDDKRKGQEAIVKFTPFTPHQLRHTCATNLYRTRIDPKMSQHFLGHADLSTTMKVYTHLDKTIIEDHMKDYLTVDFNDISPSKKVVSLQK